MICVDSQYVLTHNDILCDRLHIFHLLQTAIFQENAWVHNPQATCE